MIKLEHISKNFIPKEKKRLGVYLMRSVVANIVSRLNGTYHKTEITVLRDLSFEIKPGERVGLIGTNKSGKTTLLQIISGITEPSSGKLFVDGKVITIFNQGTILTPDLTGKEYIALHASALGADKNEIDNKIQEIIDFSEVDTIDTPVKFYSTGMKTRLTLAITLYLQADIYILDEVFAGSDAFFREKVTERINAILADTSKTLIIVSHHEEIIKKFSKRILLLENGVIKMDGNTEDVLKMYNSTASA